MKIGVITACWQRHDVLRACLNNWRALGAAEIIAVYSPGDKRSGEILKAHGCIFAQAENKLATKFNLASNLARDTDCDYFLHMGADDMIDPVVWDAYQSFKGDHMAFTDWYFHHIPTNQTRYWPGYVGAREGEPIGAGKLVSRDAMKAIGWTPFIYGRDRALDFDQHHKLANAGMGVTCYRLKDIGGIGVDLKDALNATPWTVIVPLTEPSEHLSTASPYLWQNIPKT